MKKYLAEFLAVFFIVFLAAGAIVADQELSVVQVRDSFGPLGVALAYGLAYAVTLTALGGLAGGYANPAVALALYIARRLSLKDLGGYLAAQILGAILAGVVVARAFPVDAVEAVGAGVPALGASTSLLKGGAIEIILTFVLVLVIWSVVVDPRGLARRAPLGIGLTVVVGVLAGAPFTGGIMNPARWLGPAVASAQFDSWPVWVLGPVIGALMASAAYELAFLGREAPPQVLTEPSPATPTLVDPEAPPASTTSVPATPPSPAIPAGSEEDLPLTSGDFPPDSEGTKGPSAP